MRIVALYRYPVKSMAGEPLDRADVDGKIPGDREWGVFDATTGKLLSAKSVPVLLAASARFEAGTTTIALPDGTALVAGTPDADRAVGEWLGRTVALRRAGAAATVDLELDDGTGDGPNGAKTFDTPVGSLFDSRSTLHVISTATLSALEREHPGGGDARRYRPNLVVDEITAAFAEDDWVDRDVTVGGVVAHVRKRTERCVMVSRAQPGVIADRTLIRHLVGSRNNRVGVYLDPRTSGAIVVGDPVAIGAYTSSSK
jgi:uncharacterized protein YcbX